MTDTVHCRPASQAHPDACTAQEMATASAYKEPCGAPRLQPASRALNRAFECSTNATTLNAPLWA